MSENSEEISLQVNLPPVMELLPKYDDGEYHPFPYFITETDLSGPTMQQAVFEDIIPLNEMMEFVSADDYLDNTVISPVLHDLIKSTLWQTVDELNSTTTKSTAN